MFYSLSWQLLAITLIIVGIPTVVIMSTSQNPKLTVYNYRTFGLTATVISLVLLHSSGVGKHYMMPLVVPIIGLICKTKTTITWLDITLLSALILVYSLVGYVHTPLENLILLEFISLISTVLFFLFLTKKKKNFNLVKALTPYILINFLGYVVVLFLLIILVNPTLNEVFNKVVSHLLFGYICLKLLPIPSVLLKDPIYKILTVNQLCWVITVQLGLFLVPILNLTQQIDVTNLTAVAPTLALITTVILYNLTGVRNIKQLFLYSTPLFLITVVFLITTV